jgi:beta-lactamase superfamily II metal-dependent hydrolase
MDGQLLVRVYNVGLGDCIYLRVPDTHRNVHILIDCGNKYSSINLLEDRIKELKKDLDKTKEGKRHLDLLVVSHPHEDHHKGFEEEFFDDIKIDRLWLSPAFSRENPQAKGFYALKDMAVRAISALNDLPESALDDMRVELQELLQLTKSQAIDMLNNTLPQKNGIRPLYVTADTPQEELNIFDDQDIKLKVLGPMSDIDNFYLGGNGLMSTTDELTSNSLVEGYQAIYPDPAAVKVDQPRNISKQDFELLRSSVHANTLAVAALAGHVENNLSIVLLLEWHGKRLLFSGDAEWCISHKGAVQKGNSNGSWNVMWQERKADLSLPLDFYKIGHHGSENATPWTPKDHPINQIMDKLLPKPAAGEISQAYAVASTQRTTRWPSIPNADLMEEIGKRVINVRSEYVEQSSSPKAVPAHIPQPQRTDLEDQVTQKPTPYIQIKIDPMK